MLRSILSVGGWTLASRVTGFVRDIATAAIIGAGPIADAFVVAFRLPNHFRAIFGEGAFNAAFIPSYGRIRTVEGEAAAGSFADRVYTLMLVIQLALLAIVLAVMPGFVGLLAPGLSAEPATFDLAIQLTRITFPYLFFITLVTLGSAILNAHDRFWAAAAAPILLNLSMIAALSLVHLFPGAGHAAAWGVAVSGALQLALVMWDLVRAGLRPRLVVPRWTRELGLFFRRLGPAVIGAAGVQVAMFADTIIASILPTGALSSLYYAERLYQLPLGVVGIAAGTVLLPTMSRLVAAGNPDGAHAAQNRAIGFTLALAAPCAVAFLTAPDLVVSALFQRGAFSASAAARAGAVLAAYSVGLPAAVIIRSATASFYARGDTATPLWASLTGYGVNIMLKILLVAQFGVVGLALATSVGIWTNVAIVAALAVRRGYAAPSLALARLIGATSCGCAAVAALVVLARPPLAVTFAPLGAVSEPATLAALAGAGLLVYAAVFLGVARLSGARSFRD